MGWGRLATNSREKKKQDAVGHDSNEYPEKMFCQFVSNMK